PVGGRGAQVEHVQLGEEVRQVRGHGRPPAAAPLHPGVTGSGALPLLDRLHRRGEGHVAGELSHRRALRARYFPATCLPRKSRISRAISSPSVSRAKWPASSRWYSSVFRSRLYGSAPAGGKIASFLPQAISTGGWCVRKYSCHRGYSGGLLP